MQYCDQVINFPFCKSFHYDAISHECILYDNKLEDYMEFCEVVGASDDTADQCLRDDEMYPNKCKVSFLKELGQS